MNIINAISRLHLSPDLEMAEQFLTLLDEETEQHTFQLYHDHDKKKEV